MGRVVFGGFWGMPSVFALRTILLAASAAAALTTSAWAQDSAPVASPDSSTDSTVDFAAPFVVAVEQVLVTARRREENAQEVPVALSVIGIQQIEATGSYNVAQLTQLTPSVQFFSSNPRNTAITIRGLGTSFGLTNDGLEPGVGLYIDQVYMSRPAAATFDLVDIDRVEVLRGPQGTLFGKNTTAGAINVSIQQPSFERHIQAEVSAGNYGFYQGKATISGAIAGNVLAGRLSVSGTPCATGWFKTSPPARTSTIKMISARARSYSTARMEVSACALPRIITVSRRYAAHRDSSA